MGLLILAAAGGEFYGAWRVKKYVGRLELSRIFATFMVPQASNGVYGRNSGHADGRNQPHTPQPAQPSLQPQWIAVSETTQVVWQAISYAAAGVLALAGLWCILRRRFAWRMIWAGAIAVILAGVATMVGAYVLVHHADYPPLSKRIYLAVFLVHSSPGWALLALWLIMGLAGLRRRLAVRELKD